MMESSGLEYYDGSGLQNNMYEGHIGKILLSRGVPKKKA